MYVICFVCTRLDNKPQLDAIFSMDRYSGVLTINATGPHLIAEGVSLGILTVK